jgi:CheY-like chemotaxis protein
MTTTKRPPLVIVIVEDSDEDFDTVQEAVKRAGLQVEVFRAATGGDGLTILRAQAPIRPTLVLMDLNTPGTDGREALAAMKVDPALKSVAVVVLSTSANPKDIDFCYAAGANAYHVKPVRYPDHLKVLTDLLTYWLTWAVLPAGDGGTHGS